MSHTLRDCPFCPHYQSAILTNSLDRYAVECTGCGAIGPWDTDEDAAVDGWNTRNSEDGEWKGASK